MAIELNQLRAFLKEAAATPMPSPGNQAMAAAAHIAAPPGTPPLPNMNLMQAAPEEGVSAATGLQAELDKKETELTKLRKDLQDAHAEVQHVRQMAELDKRESEILTKAKETENKMLSRIQQAESKLQDKSTQFLADEAVHHANLERDTALQNAEVAKTTSQAMADFAQQQADAYVKTTDKARQYADAYTAKQRSVIEKEKAEATKNMPLISPALQTQFDSALKAINSVKQLNKAAGFIEPTRGDNESREAFEARRRHAMADYQKQNRMEDFGAQFSPLTDNSTMLDRAVAEARMKNYFSAHKGNAEQKEWFANLQKQNQAYLTNLQEKAKTDADAKEELNRYLDASQKGSAFGDTMNMVGRKSLEAIPIFSGAEFLRRGLTKGKWDWNVLNPFNAFTGWDELDYAGDSELDQIANQYKYNKARRQTWTGNGNDFVTSVYGAVNPINWVAGGIGDIATSANNWRRASDMASRRGVERNWLSNEAPEGVDPVAWKNFQDAARDRGLNTTIMGDVGSLGWDTLSTAATFIPGIGGGARMLTQAPRLARFAGRALVANPAKAALKRFTPRFANWGGGQMTALNNAYNSALGRATDRIMSLPGAQATRPAYNTAANAVNNTLGNKWVFRTGIGGDLGASGYQAYNDLTSPPQELRHAVNPVSSSGAIWDGGSRIGSLDPTESYYVNQDPNYNQRNYYRTNYQPKADQNLAVNTGTGTQVKAASYDMRPVNPVQQAQYDNQHRFGTNLDDYDTEFWDKNKITCWLRKADPVIRRLSGGAYSLTGHQPIKYNQHKTFDPIKALSLIAKSPQFQSAATILPDAQRIQQQFASAQGLNYRMS